MSWLFSLSQLRNFTHDFRRSRSWFEDYFDRGKVTGRMGVACEESSGIDLCKVEFERVAYGISHPEGMRQARVTTSRSILRSWNETRQQAWILYWFTIRTLWLYHWITYPNLDMIFTMASSVDKINRNVNNPQFNTITIMIYGKVQRLIGVHVIWNYNAIMRVPNSAALRGRLGLLWYKHQG